MISNAFQVAYDLGGHQGLSGLRGVDLCEGGRPGLS